TRSLPTLPGLSIAARSAGGPTFSKWGLCNGFLGDWQSAGRACSALGHRLRWRGRRRLRARRRGGRRQMDRDDGALAERAIDGDAAAMQLGELADDGKAEAGAAPRPLIDIVELGKGLHQLRQILLGDADAGIDDRELDLLGPAALQA